MTLAYQIKERNHTTITN